MTAAAISYRLLGPLEVERDGRVLKVPGSRVRALLALLLLHANRHLARDQLIDELAAGTCPATPETPCRCIFRGCAQSSARTRSGATRPATKSPVRAIALTCTASRTRGPAAAAFWPTGTMR